MLNLPKSASDQEVRERYRQLSVVFHPDKQVDEGRKEAATQRFLEVQKAYEGACQPASDPSSRSSAFYSSVRPSIAVRSVEFRLSRDPSSPPSQPCI